MDINKLTENPFKAGSKAYTFFENCNVDLDTGYSDIVSLEELIQLGLKTDNGGSWCRSDGAIGKYFNISRPKKHGRINSVQLVGYKQNEFSGKIDNQIVKAYQKAKCRILDVVGHYIEIDHKDGRKQDYKLHDAQTIHDFQPLHKSCNVAKRTHCRVCTDSGVRFDATNLGYSASQHIGPKEYHGSCIGCYWFDPAVFNSIVSKDFKKER